jgi:putative hydrolase of the HAD superfamily
MTERDYWNVRLAEFSELVGHQATVPEMFAHFYSGTPEQLTRPEALALIRDAKAAGIPVGVLTNDLTAFHDQAWLDRMSVIREFDAMVDGRTDGVMKPDPAAYRLMLQRLDVPAEGTVFIDDQPRNLQGAQDVGITPVHLDPMHPQAGFAQARGLLHLPAGM